MQTRSFIHPCRNAPPSPKPCDGGSMRAPMFAPLRWAPVPPCVGTCSQAGTWPFRETRGSPLAFWWGLAGRIGDAGEALEAIPGLPMAWLGAGLHPARAWAGMEMSSRDTNGARAGEGGELGEQGGEGGGAERVVESVTGGDSEGEGGGGVAGGRPRRGG